MKHLVFLLAAAALSTPLLAQQSSVQQDPWEALNRRVHEFNTTVDQYLLLPAAKGYRAVTPQLVDDGITNMFDTIRIIPTLINDILQFELLDAARDVLRLGVNLTFGVAGIFDAASKMGIPYEYEDFGLTFAKWGLPSGPFLMIPLYGPSTVRDGIGLIPAEMVSPTFHVDHVPTRNTMSAIYYIDSRADAIDLSELVTGDSYTFFRDAYLQNRAYIINGGIIEDDFGEEDFDEDEFGFDE